MEHSWMLKYFAEFFGTLILVLFGNGSVANSFLKGTTGNAPDGKANGGCLQFWLWCNASCHAIWFNFR